MERNQFTFYKSFIHAVERIKKPAHQLTALKCIIWYALRGDIPSLDALPESVAAVLEIVMPTLQASRRKSANGTVGAKATHSGKSEFAKTTDSSKNKNKDKIKDKDNDNDKLKTKIKGNVEAAGEVPQAAAGDAAGEGGVSVCRDDLFSDFWEAYPVKVDRKSAEDAWSSLSPDQDAFDELMKNLRLWKNSARWRNEGGRFIPNPATFLDKGYWRNAPPVDTGGSYRGEIKASGTLGEAEKENIRRILMT